MGKEPSRTPLQVLCVDDDPDFLSYLLSYAQPFNLNIQTCNTLHSAFQHLNSTSFDVYIIDLHLSDGSGFDLIEKIRETQQRVQIAVITGVYRDKDNFRMMKEKYAIDFVLYKPIFPKQIENLLANICKNLAPISEVVVQDKFKKLKERYNKTICDKIEQLTKLIHAVQNNPCNETLGELQAVVHKIGGSAGSYGYPHVSNICEELDYDIGNKLKSSDVHVSKEWLFHLNTILDEIKYNFQVVVEDFKSSISAGQEAIGSRPSLYIIDDDVRFLELLERGKEQFSIDFTYESDPEKAMRKLMQPDFNPRAILFSDTFSNSHLTAYSIMDAVRKKQHFLPTIFSILLKKGSGIDARIKAIKHDIKYIFHKPISSNILLMTISKVLKVETQINFRVLVLDDDPDICRFIFNVLTETGIHVRILHNANDLYKTIEEWVPHLLLLDVLLPQYDGFSVLETLRADFSYVDLIIVMITVHNDLYTQKRAYLDNVDDILFKPLNKEVLQKRIFNLLRNHALADRLYLNKNWIGLANFTELYKKLDEALVWHDYRSHLALFEINCFNDLILQKGQGTAHELLILIGNLLIGIQNQVMQCFFNGSSKFAILFYQQELKEIEEIVRTFLLGAIRELQSAVSFNCSIVAVSKEFKSAQEVIHTVELGLYEAALQEFSSVRLATVSLKTHSVAKLVVIIDPDKDLLHLMKTAIESQGLVVRTFENGEDALENLLSLSEDQAPSLIISEKKLPDMDGLDVLNRVKMRFHTPIPFFFVTIYASDQDIAEGFGQGITEYITKPFNLSLLVQKVIKKLFY